MLSELPCVTEAELNSFVKDGGPRVHGYSRADTVAAYVRRRRRSIERRLEDPREGGIVAEELTKGGGVLMASSNNGTAVPKTMMGAASACYVVVLGDDSVSGKHRLVTDYIRRAEGIRSPSYALADTRHQQQVHGSIIPAYDSVALTTSSYDASSSSRAIRSTLTAAVGNPVASVDPNTVCLLEARVTRPVVGTPLVVLCPPSDERHTALRAEMIRASQCVVMVFSVSDPPEHIDGEDDTDGKWPMSRNGRNKGEGCAVSSFESCQRRWAAELASVEAEVGHKIPIVLVGCDADRREADDGNDGGRTNDHDNYATKRTVTSEEAVKAAQRLKANKYVEVHRGNVDHAFELFLQVLKVAGPPHRPLTAAARVALTESLRCPLVVGRYDARRGGIIIVGDVNDAEDIIGGPLLGTNGQSWEGRHITGSVPVLPPLEGRIILGTWDGSDPRVSSTAFVVGGGDHGFIPLPPAYVNPSSSSSSSQSGAASSSISKAYKSLLLASKACSLYPSEVSEVILPRHAPAPKAWFNTVTKTCVFVPAASQTSAPSVTYRYTLDGSEPNEHSTMYSGPIFLDDSNSFFPISRLSEGVATPYCIAASHLHQNAKGGGHDGHKNTNGLQLAPKTIRARAFVNVNSDGSGGNYFLPSPVVEFVVPPLIETPKVSFNAADGTLTITNAQTQIFEYRYTLDGSVPVASWSASFSPTTSSSELHTSIHSAGPTCFTYTRPVIISRNKDTHQSSFSGQIRVAAFPKQYMPSEEVIISSSSSQYPNPTATPSVFGAAPTATDMSVRGSGVGSTTPRGRERLAAHTHTLPSSQSVSNTPIMVNATRSSGLRSAANTMHKTTTPTGRGGLNNSPRQHQYVDPTRGAQHQQDGGRGGSSASPNVNPKGSGRVGVASRGNSPQQTHRRDNPLVARSISNASSEYNDGAARGANSRGGRSNSSRLLSPTKTFTAKKVDVSLYKGHSQQQPQPTHNIDNTSDYHNHNNNSTESNAQTKARGREGVGSSNGQHNPVEVNVVRRGSSARIRTAGDGRPVGKAGSSTAVSTGAVAPPPPRPFTRSSSSSRELERDRQAAGVKMGVDYAAITNSSSSGANQRPAHHASNPVSSSSLDSRDYNGDASRSEGAQHEGSSRQAASSSPQRSSQAASKPQHTAAPACRSEGNSVYFDFPVPIVLSHITITTPGRARGPDAYEVLIKTEEASEPISVGMGDLHDIEGVQTMHVVSAARTMGLRQVVCRLSGPDGFDVLDMKVHGKPKSSGVP